MNSTFSIRSPRAFAAALLATAGAASAHVVLPPGGAAAGSTYTAAFDVDQPCPGARRTTALAVRLPAGFRFVSAPPRPGWTMSEHGGEVTWTAGAPADTQAGGQAGRFVVVGRLTGKPGTLWFRAHQSCDVGSADWAAIPDAKTPAPAFPAPHLDVLPAGVAAVDVRGAWARATVPGQPTTVVYATLSAPSGARLVAASSPVGAVSVHEMRMDGNVMRMRDLPGGLDLPPGQPVALAPGGLHLMITGLKQPLAAGSTLPLVLHFVDRDGRKGDAHVDVPVTNAAPAMPAMHPPMG